MNNNNNNSNTKTIHIIFVTGTIDEIKTFTTETGARVAEVGGEIKEIVIATAADITKLGLDATTMNLQEGVYLVGTGSTGASETFVTLGCTYFSTMLLASFLYRVPKDGWIPDGWEPPPVVEEKKHVNTNNKTIKQQTDDDNNVVVVVNMDNNDDDSSSTADDVTRKNEEKNKNNLITTANVDIDQSLKTPQFYLLWTNLFCNVSAGIGVLGVAKTMMGDIFSTSMPSIVDTAFAATYVSMISVANMSGRFFWASTSDFVGRKNTFNIFFGLGIPLYMSIPYIADMTNSTDSIAPLILFYGTTMCIFTMYGGGFATVCFYL